MAGARVGRDCNLCDHVFIESGAALGDRVTVKNNAIVGEGILIESDVFLGPGMIITNDLYPRSPRLEGVEAVTTKYHKKANWLSSTRVCKGASIGAGAIVICGVTIGAYAMIGAGALVTESVAPHRLVVGIPAKPIGWVCLCGRKLQVIATSTLQCPQCQRQYRLLKQRLKLI